MGRRIYHSPWWKAARVRVLRRDGFVCQIGLPGCKVHATAVDHRFEMAFGGDEVVADELLQAACRSCNTAKRNRAQAVAARRAVRSW